MEINHEVGLFDKVIVRDNEDGAFLICKVIGFDNFGGKSRVNLPIVEDEAGRSFVCAGIVVKYSDELVIWLNTMTPKEQWKALSHRES